MTVEIFKAGDGVNYPKPGNVVTLHYVAYVRLAASRITRRPGR